MILLKDGDFRYFYNVMTLICGAGDVPLSVVLVGVGNCEFVPLENLDGDNKWICSTDGTACARDIAHFQKFQFY